MPSLECRSGRYRVVFRFAGRKFCRTLRTTNERQAQATLARLEDNLRRLELGIITLRPDADLATFLLSDGRESTKPQLPVIQTIGRLFESYFEVLPPGTIEVTTEDGMKRHARHFCKFLGERFPIQGLERHHLQDYVDQRSRAIGRAGEPISPATIKKELRTFTTIWNWALHGKLLSKPFPKRGLKFPKQSEKPPFQTLAEVETRIQRGGLTERQIHDLWDAVFLSLAELDLLLSHVEKAARYSFILPMFVFAAHTGARRSELLRVRIDDIDFSSRTILIHEKKRVRGKLSTRRVPMSPRLEDVVSSWLSRHPGGQSLFCKGTMPLRGSKPSAPLAPLTVDEAQHHFKAALVGSRWAKLRGWHVFRHSFCSNCAARGVDQRVINAWVGHQTEEMVQRYRHLLPNQQRDAIRMVFGG